MNIYDNNYEDEDYSKMMEETGNMLNQFEYLKNQLNNEFDEILKLKLIPDDISDISVKEYEDMVEERNKVLTDSLSNLKKIDANISYLKDVGLNLLVKSGIMKEEDYRNTKFLDFILETMDYKNKDLLHVNTIIDEYKELKLGIEVDMLIITEDSNMYKDYRVSDLEDKYNEDSEDLEHIDKVLFELEMSKLKIVNDLKVLTDFITPKEEEKTKKKKKGEK